VLSGLIRKIKKDADVRAFGGPDDLGEIVALSAHAGPVR